LEGRDEAGAEARRRQGGGKAEARRRQGGGKAEARRGGDETRANCGSNWLCNSR
jgi:hypothetical protein